MSHTRIGLSLMIAMGALLLFIFTLVTHHHGVIVRAGPGPARAAEESHGAASAASSRTALNRVAIAFASSGGVNTARRLA